MKGQYLAVESVFTFGLGLILAIGVIGAFETYSSGVYEVSEEVQASMIQNRILESFNVLQAVEGSGEVNLNLPDTVGSQDYRINANDDLVIEAGSVEYESKVPVSGTVAGSGSGEIRITKSGNSYEISDR